MHLNIAFREPLVPDGDESWPEPLDAEPRWSGCTRAVSGTGATSTSPPVAGPSSSPATRRLPTRAAWPRRVAGRCWPSRRPGTGPARTHWPPTGCCSTTSVTTSSGWSSPAGRRCPGRSPGCWPAPTSRWCGCATTRAPRRSPGTPIASWLNRWLDADALADDAVAQVLTAEPLNGLAVARVVAASVPVDGLLVAGSSSAVRDLDLADPWEPTRRWCSRTAAPPASTARCPPRSVPPWRTAARRTP